MIKKVFSLLLPIFFAALVAFLIQGTQGSVVIQVAYWQIRTTFGLFVIVLLLAFLSFYLILRLIWFLRSIPGNTSHYLESRHREQGHQKLNEAIRLLFEGRYKQAMRVAAQANKNTAVTEMAGVSALIAARAAYEMQDTVKQKEWLEQARQTVKDKKSGKSIEAACLLQEAEMHLEEKDYSEVLNTLERLKDRFGHQGGDDVLKMEMRAYRALGDWDNVLHVVRKLQKNGSMPESGAAALKEVAHLENLQRHCDDARQILNYLSKSIPSGERNPRIIERAVQHLVSLEADQEAQKLLENLLDQCMGSQNDIAESYSDWRPELFALYGQIEGGDLKKRIAHAEHWVQSCPADDKLLLTLGKLCGQEQLWGKAQDYLEASLRKKPSAVAHKELAFLFEKIDQPERAAEHFKQASELIQ